MMKSRLVQWVLSKLFPYTKPTTVVKEYGSHETWRKRKLRENEEFYGRQDGWRC